MKIDIREAPPTPGQIRSARFSAISFACGASIFLTVACFLVLLSLFGMSGIASAGLSGLFFLATLAALPFAEARYKEVDYLSLLNKPSTSLEVHNYRVAVGKQGRPFIAAEVDAMNAFTQRLNLAADARKEIA